MFFFSQQRARVRSGSISIRIYETASCPGLPGCWSQGDTEEEALDNVKQAIEEYLAAIKETFDGEKMREVEVVV